MVRRGLVLFCGVLMVCGVGGAPSARAGDGAWPQPYHDVYSTGANPDFASITPVNVGTLRQVWTSSPTGAYFDPPTVVGGVAYLATGLTDVRAIDVVTGKLRWRHAFAYGAQTQSVSVSGSLVFVAVSDEGLAQDRRSGVYALDRATGKTVWSYTRHDGGELEHIVLAAGELYAPFQLGQLVVLNPASGAVLRTLYPDALQEFGLSYYAGHFYAPTDPSGYGITVFSAASGETLPGPRILGYTAYQPAITDGMAFIAQENYDVPGGSTVYGFTANACPNSGCAPRWHTAIAGIVYGRPAVSGGRVYVPTAADYRIMQLGGLSVLDEASGKPLWSWINPDPQGIVTGVSVGGGVAYVVSRWSGDMYIFRAAGCGASTCQPLLTIPLADGDGPGLNPPALADGTAVVSGWHDIAAFRPTRTAVAPLSVVAARGGDGALHARRSTATSWTSLGGRPASPPAMVSDGHRIYYLIEGADHFLYSRTAATRWRRVSNRICRQPAAARIATTVSVACRGADGGLLAGRATINHGVLGTVGGFVHLANSLRGGAAATAVDGTFMFAITGTDNIVRTKLGSGGWTATSLRCSSPPALAAAGGSTYLACRAGDLLRWTRDVGAGFVPYRDIKVSTAGRPALTIDATGSATVYRSSANGRVYRTTLALSNTWTHLSGLTTTWLGAAQLRG